MTDDEPILEAPRYGLLLAGIYCYSCQAHTPTATIWMADFQEREQGDVLDEGEAALLTYVQWLDPKAAELVTIHAPWLRLAATKMSGMTYWANHCETCGAIQGDHYVHEVDGPYWPRDDSVLARLTLVPGPGILRARGSASQSSWMSRVEDVCQRG